MAVRNLLRTNEFGVQLQVMLVPLEKNKADVIPRFGSGRGCTEYDGCSVSPRGTSIEEIAQNVPYECR